jgi:transposase-like protein
MHDTLKVRCPYCGKSNEIYIDFSGGEHQSYVEDCQICCQPWQLEVDLSDEEPVVFAKVDSE